MRGLIVDANVFVSFFIERHEARRAAARDLLQSAEDGEIAAIIPQSVVFEVAYVLANRLESFGLPSGLARPAAP